MNNFNDKQLTILGFKNNEVWLKNREMLGHKEGESFEDFFQRKHGYPSKEHDVQRKKRDLSKNEKLRQDHDVLQNDYIKFGHSTLQLFKTLDKEIKDLRKRIIILEKIPKK